MFLIAHNKQFVFSTIIVSAKKLPLEEMTIHQLMFLWANEAAIPHINRLRFLKDDNTAWYIK